MASTLVLGGGISGLSAAYYLRGKTALTLVEGSSRLGGWICSDKRADGVIFERGPRTIRPVGAVGANTLNLVEDLGLKEKVWPIPRSHPAAQNRLIYAKGNLNPLPSSAAGLFKRLPPFSKPLVACAWTDLWAPKREAVDESAHDFFARRFGQDVADYAVAPLHCGVCAGSSKEISVKMLFRPLFEAEQRHGSVLRGMLKKSPAPTTPTVEHGGLARRAALEKWSFYSIHGGLATLTERMTERLSEAGVDVRLNDECVSLHLSNGSARIKLKSGHELQAENVICALPAGRLAPLLNAEHPELSRRLSEQQSVTVAVVNMRFKGGSHLKSPAFGFLVPPIEKSSLLGVIYDSACFDNEAGDTVLTAMMGGHWFHPQFSGLSEQQIAEIAVTQTKCILGIEQNPIDVSTNIQINCIPQYTVGHYERLEAIDNYVKQNKLPLHLVGASYRGIGINDVIMSAKLAVDNLSK